MHQLVILDARQRKRSVPLRPGSYRIGSDAACEIRLGGGGVCALHAVIHDRLGGLSIAVLEEGAGLSVNGVPVTEAKLKSGDTIQLGPFQMAVQARRGHGRRTSVHPIQILAVTAVLLLFIAQSIMLLRFSSRRLEPIAPGKPDPASTNAPAGDAEASFHVPMTQTNEPPPAAATSTNAEARAGEAARTEAAVDAPATNAESNVESAAPSSPTPVNPPTPAVTNDRPAAASANAIPDDAPASPSPESAAPRDAASPGSTNAPPTPDAVTNPPAAPIAQPPPGN